MDEATLNRLAVEALLEEAKIGAKRAEISGPSGWVKPKESVNKRFLHSTLRNVVLSNKKRLKKDTISKSTSPNNSEQNSESYKKIQDT
ncbi:uncharacterized protein LOC117177412 [Belonocnema kinseyi]|uniref:uncharacterized protein LOC117177412 n=1 Tax=Belonocnema kinseyi TaxID=2817044 RepID=UPI00143D5B8C|nr:uncharacterized protein LOC117177412 [Belonocnema kinseyi]XP_033223969.1 uncharacterized protein LOC117177412 [Belonocnema kinseyi]XP_033223970.1 uncharacterized protein LOC117177412 [Belonocnema kinseyi]XP_033223971.1 uncharacterized protein LOC117177412 [Belonocnema kinseyi]XP_033223972.1 uncharacterized protein LOC117177412 [Belonocnema kinseyi]